VKRGIVKSKAGLLAIALVAFAFIGTSLVWAAEPSVTPPPPKDWTDQQWKDFLKKPWTKEELSKMGRPPRYILKKEENIKPRATGKVLTPEQLFQNGKNFWYPIMVQYGIGISCKDFYKLWIENEGWRDPKIRLLDIRQESEFDQAHIPGGIRVDTGLAYWQLPGRAPDSTADYYLLCKGGTPHDGGDRGGIVKRYMLQMGYSGKILNITDGFRGWIEEGYPVVNAHGLFVLVPGTFQIPEKDSMTKAKEVTPKTAPMVMDLARQLGIQDW